MLQQNGKASTNINISILATNPEDKSRAFTRASHYHENHDKLRKKTRSNIWRQNHERGIWVRAHEAKQIEQ